MSAKSTHLNPGSGIGGKAIEPAPAVRIWPFLLMAALALVLAVHSLQSILPLSSWIDAVRSPSDIRRAIFFYGALPRVAISLIAGAALGLSGTLLQRVLRNPLAEPTTLGISAGAQLALTAATLYAPSLLIWGREEVALTGAVIAALFVLALAWRQGFASLPVILAGLVVNLLAGACGAVLALFHGEYLQSIFVWDTGTLVQDDWTQVSYLLPRLLGAVVIAPFLARPLSMLALDDENARSLGVPLRTIRLLALGIAVELAAFVVSAVGVISFVSLAAPTLVRLAGARRFPTELVAAPLAGACLLWLTDQLVQCSNTIMPELATGVATALLGAPLLLWMLTHLRIVSLPPQIAYEARRRASRPFRLIAIYALFLIAMISMALDFGQSAQGWHFSNAAELHNVLQWRWPHVTSALAAGAMLAVAGVLMQRLTGNAMASPEVLGISQGALIGVIALVLFVSVPEKPVLIAAGACGAFLTLAGLLILGRRSSFSPERMLLIGVALASTFSAISTLILASGLPRVSLLLSWMAGSTNRLTPADASVVSAIALIFFAIIPLLTRWLEILPIGEATGHALGIGLGRSRLAILTIASVLVAAATLIVGPLTFVGLMAPHLARMNGLQRALPQLLGAAMIGGLLMVSADWLGHNIVFPYQIPSGLLASLIGAPCFIALVWRRPI